jgi:plastocyanin
MIKRARVSIICATAILVAGLATYLVLANVYSPRKHNVAAAPESSPDKHHGQHGGPKTDSLGLGILANATVSFGAWLTTPPLDRFPNNSPAGPNLHELVPQVAVIRAGGTVNFIIGGFHHVLVYDDGTKPDDINDEMTIPPTMGGPPLINDPNRRIYRGLDPSTQTRDRVEVVHFEKPGTYLVICGVQPHFRDGMYGFVKVLR